MNIGKFITFEGVDGTGKSTLLQKIASALTAYLQDSGQAVVKTKEPGASQGGQKIRNLLFKDPGTSVMFPGQADCLLLYDHIGNSEGVVRPALERGDWVLCDRWPDSQFAYTAARKGTEHVNAAFLKHYGPKPDVTFLLIGTVEMLLARAKARDDAPDANEPGKHKGKTWSTVADQVRIQDAYLLQLGAQARTIIINVDGKDAGQVYTEAWEKLMVKLSTPPVVTQPPLFNNDWPMYRPSDG